MPGAHRRSRPEGYDETEIDRMPDKTVEERRPEDGRRHLAAYEIVGDLMESEQFKMIDQEGAREHDHPTDERQCRDHHGHFGLLGIPDHGRHWTPLAEQ